MILYLLETLIGGGGGEGSVGGGDGVGDEGGGDGGGVMMGVVSVMDEGDK